MRVRRTGSLGSRGTDVGYGVVIPETRYAKSGHLNIAYQVSGDGPFDLVFAPGYVPHLELHWSIPSFAPVLERLGSFSRLIRFDKRGTGMSARGSGRRALAGTGGGGPG